MSEFRIDQIKSQDATRGPDVAGITTFTGTSGIVMPSGDTAYRGGRGRGVIAGGYSAPAKNNVMDIVQIATTGNAISFGNLTTARSSVHSCSSSTRMVTCGGYAPANTNVMEYVSISAGGHTFDFGDNTTKAAQHSGCSNEIRGIFSGGYIIPTTFIDQITQITIATKGDASEFGSLRSARFNTNSTSNSTRGLIAAGSDTTRRNWIEYVTISTTGNAEDFGDLAFPAQDAAATASSPTRGVFAGGINPSILANGPTDYVEFATLGNAIDFGDITSRGYCFGTSNSIRGIIAGGITPSVVNTIEFITIATTGDATDFGDMTEIRTDGTAASDSHGGLG